MTIHSCCVIGGGKMGGALVEAFIKFDVFQPKNLTVTCRRPERAQVFAQKFGVEALADNGHAVVGKDMILLAVKPQGLPGVLREIGPKLKAGQIIVSLAAAAPLHWMESLLPTSSAVVRAMPNLPSLIGQGMTVLCPGNHVDDQQLNDLKAVFGMVGRVAITDNQDHMDGVTALSGSGPAYGYIIIESLAEGGVKVGLPRQLATELAAQAILGSASMVLESGEHPAKLKDMVTTPAGTTVDGIMALEEGSLRVALIKAVDAATQKAREIGRNIRRDLEDA